MGRTDGKRLKAVSTPARCNFISEMVKCIDDNLGKLVHFLKEEGLYENTLIIFTSDHGDLCGEHHRHNKSVPYEMSARVPFVMHCPQLIDKKSSRQDGFFFRRLQTDPPGPVKCKSEKAFRRL